MVEKRIDSHKLPPHAYCGRCTGIHAPPTHTGFLKRASERDGMQLNC